MSDSKFRPKRRNPAKPPRWFTNMIRRRPERQATRRLIQKLLSGSVADLDTYMFAEGRKPDATWEWD